MRGMGDMDFSLSGRERGPSRQQLMAGLMIVSLGLHLLILMQMPGFLGGRPLTMMEFSVEDRSGPGTRSIPRPRIRSRAAFQAPDIQKAEVPAKVSMAECLPDGRLPAPINVKTSALPSVPKPSPGALVRPVSAFAGISGQPLNTGTSVSTQFLTRKDYFEMLRLRIETHKKYPPKARSKYIEGRVGLYFRVGMDGSISDLKIVRPARHNSLNRAALKAVTDSTPFSMLPAALFEAPVEIEITLLFELA